MSIQIEKKTLEYESLKGNAFAFVPNNPLEGAPYCLFTHGATSHKGAILTWPQRMVDKGYPTVIFDLPGHFLGGFHKVDSFENFTQNSYQLFFRAYEFLEALMGKNNKIVLGGHSLGAYFSLEALASKEFNSFEKVAVCVGLGRNDKNNHIFDDSLFEKTMIIRNGLIDSKIHTDKMFPWLKEAKKNINISNQRIHFICGQNDMVVGKNGAQLMVSELKAKGNEVSFDDIKNLPHHLPEHAARHIFNFVKDF